MLIKYEQDGQLYALVTGRLYSLKFRESVGEKQKPFATFGIAYGFNLNEWGKAENLYMNCVAWGALADFVSELQERQDKPSVMVCGKIKVSEYRGESREQLECDFIQLQPTTITEEKKSKRKKTEEEPFDDINF